MRFSSLRVGTSTDRAAGSPSRSGVEQEPAQTVSAAKTVVSVVGRRPDKPGWQTVLMFECRGTRVCSTATLVSHNAISDPDLLSYRAGYKRFGSIPCSIRVVKKVTLELNCKRYGLLIGFLLSAALLAQDNQQPTMDPNSATPGDILSPGYPTSGRRLSYLS